MSRKIKALGVKMVLSGEGSDELFGGYLYFHKAPNKEEFHKETCRKVIHTKTIRITFLIVLVCFENKMSYVCSWYSSASQLVSRSTFCKAPYILKL
jgi:asparagine synthetase B (glutamine-hydrolysing)